MRMKVGATIASLLCLVVSVVGTAPASAAGAFTITPSTGLVDLQEIAIAGSGFAPGTLVGICEGVQGDPLGLDLCGPSISLTASTSGSFSTTFRVRRIISIPRLGHTVDCADPASVCGIGVADVLDLPGSIVVQPISFAPTPPPPATRGTVTVPPGPFFGGQVITATGSGFRPGAAIVVLECRPAPTDPNQCKLVPPGEIATATADSSGGFTAAVSVAGAFSNSLSEPPVVCDPPGSCVVAAAEAVDFAGTVVTTPLSFRAAVSRPDGQIVRLADGEVTGGDIYNLDAAGQRRTRTVTPGATWSYQVRVENDGELGEEMRVNGPASSGPFTLTYFYGYYDVTPNVTSGYGLALPVLEPGQSADLAVRFQVSPTATVGAAKNALVRFTSFPGGVQDAVRVGVRVVAPS